MRPDRAKDTRPKKAKAESKVSVAVRRWLAEVLPQLPVDVADVAGVDDAGSSASTLVGQAPRRWTVYEPMVLLPTGSFGSGPWPGLLAAASAEQRDALWSGILAALSPPGGQLTHLAVNEGIPLHVEGGDGGGENILRSPTGLRPLYGDFGPAAPSREADFGRALWVSTRQNGIVQTWAPRWSMFSRGNIKEKARLLGWGGEGEGEGEGEGKPASEARTKTTKTWAVDLYAGIGYFVFSYARRGLRVLCWELNPWSAEALRRGGARNGWRVRVVAATDEDDASLCRQTLDAVADDAEIVVFVEDNRHAARRLAALRSAGLSLPVAHVNCGMLPTSRDSWRTAYDAVVEEGRGGSAGAVAWLHLHENVGVADVEARRRAIQQLVDTWTAVDRPATACVEHVELVKTFAPGVWHCVFDVRITLP